MDAVVFDLLGVIIDEENIASKRLYAMLPEPRTISSEELKTRYAEGLKIGAMTPEEFWSFLITTDWELFERQFLDDLRIMNAADRVLGALRNRVQLGAISELPRRWGTYVLGRHRLSQDFKQTVFSDDYKATKSESVLFEALSEKLKVPFGSMAYIDDKLKNLKMAGALGIKETIWFKRNEQELIWKPNAVVTRLEDLTDIILG